MFRRYIRGGLLIKGLRLLKGTRISLTIFMVSALALAIYVVATYRPTLKPTDLAILLVYLVLLILLESFPIKIGRTCITFGFALSFIVFLKYGLVLEMLMVQVAVIISAVFVRRIRVVDVIIFNMAMLIYVSILSAAVYFAAGGKVGFMVIDLPNMTIPILAYGATYFLFNHLLLSTSNLFLKDQRKSPFLRPAIWDGLVFIFSLTFGVLMYIANATFGLLALATFAALFLMVILVIRLYANHRQLNLRIKTVNQMVNRFTSELDLRRVIEAIQSALPDLMEYDYGNVNIINNDEIRAISAGKDQLEDECDVLCGEAIKGSCSFRNQLLATVIENKEPFLVSDTKKLLDWPKLDCPREARSILAMPMLWDNQVLGVISFASRKWNAFTRQDIEVLNLFSSRAALALNNASNYKVVHTMSYLDELTGLSNYRALIDLLVKKIEAAEQNEESLSLLMIDIDHFKEINDSYGHLSGNQVLRELASLLAKYTRAEDLVFRFGGEEFVVIIPQGTEELAYEIAERIREKVAEHNFVLTETFDKDVETIKLTVSIGIATYPDQAQSYNDLIRFSDRALYYGAKKKGRNKVAIYRRSDDDD